VATATTAWQRGVAAAALARQPGISQHNARSKSVKRRSMLETPAAAVGGLIAGKNSLIAWQTALAKPSA